MTAGTLSGNLSRAELVALLVVTIWGTNFVAIKAVLDEFDVLAFTFLRYTGMLVLGWGVVLWLRIRGPVEGQLRLGIRRADLPRMALAGVLGFSLYMLLWAVGLNYTTAFSGALLLGTAPLFMMVLLWTLRIEPVHAAQWLAVIAGFAGVAVFVLGKSGAGRTAAGAGDLISLAAALCYAAYVVANKPLAARYSAPALTTYTLTIGAMPVLLLTLPSLLAQDWSRVTLTGWAVLAWAAVVPVYVAWALWSWTNARIGVGRASIFMYLVPIIGGATAWLLRGERISIQGALGATLVLAGLVLARRQPAAQPAVSQSLGVPAQADGGD